MSSSTMSSTNNTLDNSFDNTFNMINPKNIIIYMVFYSSIILISFITFLSFIFQNFKGIIYLGFILAAAILRYFIYYLSGSLSDLNNNNINKICKSVMYTQYGNSSFSVFVFTFTSAYLFIPMFLNGHANYWIFCLLLIYGLIDFFIKYQYNCIKSASDTLLNVAFGLLMSTIFVTSMYSGGSQDFLFFNEMNTGAETYSRPKNQQFKCKVYKNGELIATSSS